MRSEERESRNSSSELSVLIFVLFLAHLSNKWDLQWKLDSSPDTLASEKTICCLSSNHLINPQQADCICSHQEHQVCLLHTTAHSPFSHIKHSETYRAVCLYTVFWIKSRIHSEEEKTGGFNRVSNDKCETLLNPSLKIFFIAICLLRFN